MESKKQKELVNTTKMKQINRYREQCYGRYLSSSVNYKLLLLFRVNKQLFPLFFNTKIIAAG